MQVALTVFSSSRLRPQALSRRLHCRFSSIDANNVLTVFDMSVPNGTDAAGRPLFGAQLDFEKKDVWVRTHLLAAARYRACSFVLTQHFVATSLSCHDGLIEFRAARSVV